MFTCGTRGRPVETRAARFPRDEVGGRGHDLHQARGAGVRRPLAELRLGVDHPGDQRRVEILLGRLLADHVLVAKRKLDLLHRLVGPRRSRRLQHEREHTRRSPARAARRRGAAPGGGGAGGAVARARRRLAGALIFLSYAGPRQLLLKLAERARVSTASVAFSPFLLGELAGVPLVDDRVPATSGPLHPDVLVGVTAIVASKHGLHARLEQQRRLDDRAGGRGLAPLLLLPPPDDPLADPRPDQPLEPAAPVRRSAKARRATAARSTPPPAPTTSPQRPRRPRAPRSPVELVDHRVRRERRRAETLQARRVPRTCPRRSRRSDR